MAATRKRRTNTRSVIGAQKQINRDYLYLARDYKKLGMEILRRPVTKYILGGVALTAIVPYVAPVIMRLFRDDRVTTFVRENVDDIRTRIDGFIHTADSDLDALNQ